MSSSCGKAGFIWWRNVVKTDGSKERPIAPRNAESFLEITLHLLSTFISFSFSVSHVYNIVVCQAFDIWLQMSTRTVPRIAKLTEPTSSFAIIECSIECRVTLGRDVHEEQRSRAATFVQSSRTAAAWITAARYQSLLDDRIFILARQRWSAESRTKSGN